MAVLSVKNLTKTFKKKGGIFTAVDNISFDLKEGEILGVLGPNGAGKTTTIQMLLGVMTPTSGQIEYFGKDFMASRQEVMEHINFASTYTSMPWRLTVRECMTFIAYLYDIKDRKARIERIRDLFRLEEIWTKEFSSLSAGQVTRLNIAKAFINFPKVILLDEPTASLDPESAKYIRDFMLREQDKFNTSIILTSHNMAEVEEVCDRVIFVNHGRIIADNTPDELAKTIKISHVELYVKDGLKRLMEYCGKNGNKFEITGRNIVVDIEERNIPAFLKSMYDMGVFYEQISIEKPTLEDYFISMAHQT